jgi:GGDEF domain-containing protein
MTMVDSLTQLIFNIYEAFTVALYVRDKDRLICLSSMTFATSFEKNRAIPVEGTLPGLVMKRNEPLIIPNFDKDEKDLGYYGAKENIKAFMAYPVEPDGVIVVDSKKRYAFPDKEKKILASFVSVIHGEIERERKYQDTEERIEELHGEKRITSLFSELNTSKITAREIFRETLHYSGADFCFVGKEKNGRIFIHDIFGVDPEDYVKRECIPGESIASKVVELGGELLLPFDSGYLKGKPLFFMGEIIKARQFFGFPLIADDAVVGVIGFGTLSEEPMKEGAIGILRSVSSLFSLYYAYLWMRDHIEQIKEFEPVTGSIQFTTFLGIMEKMIKKGDRFHLLSVKLPHLRVYNKKMGHKFANGMLVHTARIIRHCAGNTAFITRKGGGHFYVLIRGADPTELRNIVKVMNYTIRKGIFEDKTWDVDSAVESGAASFPEDGRELWTLLEKVDEKRQKMRTH